MESLPTNIQVQGNGQTLQENQKKETGGKIQSIVRTKRTTDTEQSTNLQRRTKEKEKKYLNCNKTNPNCKIRGRRDKTLKPELQ